MIRFRHNREGCTSEVLRYLGTHRFNEFPGMIVRHSEWRRGDGSTFEP